MITINMAMVALMAIWFLFFLALAMLEELNLTFGFNTGLPRRDTRTGELNED